MRGLGRDRLACASERAEARAEVCSKRRSVTRDASALVFITSSATPHEILHLFHFVVSLLYLNRDFILIRARLSSASESKVRESLISATRFPPSNRS